MPCARASQPMPPPSVRPPRPTSPVSPNGVARPWAAAAVVYSPAVVPPWAVPVRRNGSMSTARIARRSISRPPSVVEWPATLWPPPRTAMSRPSSRPATTARAISEACRGAGRWRPGACRTRCCGRRARRRSRRSPWSRTWAPNSARRVRASDAARTLGLGQDVGRASDGAAGQGRPSRGRGGPGGRCAAGGSAGGPARGGGTARGGHRVRLLWGSLWGSPWAVSACSPGTGTPASGRQPAIARDESPAATGRMTMARAGFARERVPA